VGKKTRRASEALAEVTAESVEEVAQVTTVDQESTDPPPALGAVNVTQVNVPGTVGLLQLRNNTLHYEDIIDFYNEVVSCPGEIDRNRQIPPNSAAHIDFVVCSIYGDEGPAMVDKIRKMSHSEWYSEMIKLFPRSGSITGTDRMLALNTAVSRLHFDWSASDLVVAARQFIGSLFSACEEVGVAMETIDPAKQKSIIKQFQSRLFNASAPHNVLSETIREAIQSEAPDTLSNWGKALLRVSSHYAEIINSGKHVGMILIGRSSLGGSAGNSSRPNSVPGGSHKASHSKKSKVPESKHQPPSNIIKGTSCFKCGWNHKAAVCKSASHPDANKDPKVPFLQSKIGKHYASLGLTGLRMGAQYDSTKQAIVLTKKVSNPESLLSINDSSDLFSNRQVKGSTGKYKDLDVLLDSGADSSNYISSELSNKLTDVVRKNINATVCSCFSNCKEVNELVTFTLTLTYLNKSHTFPFTAKVLEGIHYDIIIGLPTHRQQNLTKIFPSYFSDVEWEKEVNLSSTNMSVEESVYES
jgi:hypothetical protein